jgi:hypothetical protein
VVSSPVPGIGKSRLVRAALDSSVGAGTTLLDCRRVEPTPAGFIASLAAELGCPHRSDIGLAAERIASGGDGPSSRWTTTRLRRSTPGGRCSCPHAVASQDRWARPPARQVAARLGRPRAGAAPGPLSQSGDRAAAAPRRERAGRGAVNGFARGHPLALELGASALMTEPTLEIERGPPPAVIRQLLDALLAGLAPRTLETLEAVSTSRRVTEPVLRSLLARSSVRGEFDALRRLPFVEETPEGLVVHDIVREAIAAGLRERDPELHARYRRRSWSYFEARAAPRRPSACGGHRGSHLPHREPGPARRPLPPGPWRTPSSRRSPPTALPSGRSSRGTRGRCGRAARPLVGPSARSLLRRPRPDGAAGAILHLSEIGDIDPELVASDPVARAWHAHLAAVPPRSGDRVLTMRRWLGRDSGEMLSPAVGACWLDVKRAYMELRPRLSRLYSVMEDPEALAPIFAPLGFARSESPSMSPALQQPVWLDFGEGSVDGWLRRLVVPRSTPRGRLMASADAPDAGPTAGDRGARPPAEGLPTVPSASAW